MKLPDCSKDAVSDADIEHNPQQLREALMSKYDAGVRNDKIFSKQAKHHVTSVKISQASAARRKHEARFSCPIEGCNSNFTRRHNLNSENFIEPPCNPLKPIIWSRPPEGTLWNYGHGLPHMWKGFHHKFCPQTPSLLDLPSFSELK